jgi:N-acetylglucosamine-6-phosphate deacetylase
MTRIEALAQALTLAIVAPTDEQSEQAVELAEDLAIGMNQRDIEQAKHIAKKEAKTWTHLH